MFQKKELEFNYDLIIGQNSIIRGDVDCNGSIRVDGKIFGDLTSSGNVIVSESASITGNITCFDIEIYGKCCGDVSVKGKINLHQHSQLTGDIKCSSFNTEDGSKFSGQCNIDPNVTIDISVDIENKLADSSDIAFIDSPDSIDVEHEEKLLDSSSF